MDTRLSHKMTTAIAVNRPDGGIWEAWPYDCSVVSGPLVRRAGPAGAKLLCSSQINRAAFLLPA